MAKHKRLGNGKGRPKINHERGPTPETMEKRRMLAGNGNPEKAWNALGVLRERGLITQAQHDAGWNYAQLRRRHIGRPEARTPGNEPMGQGRDGTDPRERELEEAFNEARAILLASGRRAFDAVQNVAVFDRIPRWALCQNWRPGDRRDRDALLDGLAALCPRQARAA